MKTGILPKSPVGEMSKLDIILSFIEAKYILVPLRDKIPCCKPGCREFHKGCGDGWEKTEWGRWTAEELAPYNYGVVLQPDDLVIDVDPRNFSAQDHPLKRLIAEVGPLDSFVVKSGRGDGGIHVYTKKPAEALVKCKMKEYPGIDFRTVGGQMVGPGSIHPDTGGIYKISARDPKSVIQAPVKLLELAKKTEIPFAELEEGTKTYINDTPTQGRYAHYLEFVAPNSGSFSVACMGRDMGLPPGSTLNLMLEVWNPRRNNPKTEDQMKEKVIHAYTYASGKVGSAHPSIAFDVIADSQPPAKIKKEDVQWNMTKQGGFAKTFHNLCMFLKHPNMGLRGVFAHNEFTGRNEFAIPAPWHNGKLPRCLGVSDADLKLLKGYLSTHHKFEANCNNIEEAVTNIAHENRFHPVREYLNSLKWDGVKRLNNWLKDYCGAVDGGHPIYLEAVSRKVLCAAVIRAFKPGYDFHHVLVLEGAQDIGKSSIVRILGGKWGSDAPVDPHNRDTVDAMQGRWIIEIAEMEVLRKTDEDALKAFITRPTDRCRLAYGRTTGEFPRQSIFIATKNPRADGTYLKDDTGNRRWWPVRLEPRHNALGQIDFKGLKEARNQLFAEAVHEVTSPRFEELSMHTLELKTAAREVAGMRHAEHEWTECIQNWIALCDQKESTRRDFLTAREVFLSALTGSDRLFDMKSQKAIAAVMRGLGWNPANRWSNGNQVRGWERERDVKAVLGDLL